MSDSISRTDAIRWVKTECNPYGLPTLDYDSGLKVIEHLKKMPSADAEDAYKAHEEEHLNIANRIKELQYAIAKTQTIVGKMVESAEAEWIPCSKGLPKAEYGESDCVLATCCWKSDTTTRWIEKLYFDGGNWDYPTGERFTQKVLAWTPMIEPYREDGEE